MFTLIRKFLGYTMRPNAIVIEIEKKILMTSTATIFIRIVNIIVTETRMSNFYLVWKWNHFIGHQLQTNIEFFFNLLISFLTLTCVTLVFS